MYEYERSCSSYTEPISTFCREYMCRTSGGEPGAIVTSALPGTVSPATSGAFPITLTELDDTLRVPVLRLVRS